MTAAAAISPTWTVAHSGGHPAGTNNAVASGIVTSDQGGVTGSIGAKSRPPTPST